MGRWLVGSLVQWSFSSPVEPLLEAFRWLVQPLLVPERCRRRSRLAAADLLRRFQESLFEPECEEPWSHGTSSSTIGLGGCWLAAVSGLGSLALAKTSALRLSGLHFVPAFKQFRLVRLVLALA